MNRLYKLYESLKLHYELYLKLLNANSYFIIHILYIDTKLNILSYKKAVYN